MKALEMFEKASQINPQNLEYRWRLFDLYLNNSWEFLQADSPFSFNNIYISNGAQVFSEDNVSITANNLSLDKNSSFVFSENEALNIPQIKVDGASTMTLSGSEKIIADTLNVTGNSTVTVAPEKILSLTIPNINIDTGSFISADEKGFSSNEGPGTSTDSATGASYGGMGYPSSTAMPTYGSKTNPVDFGSNGAQNGGGSVQLTVSGALKNDGTISANGGSSGSGGSVNINTGSVSGAGIISANGGSLYANGYFKGPGGGGRTALSYENSSFSGMAQASGGCGSYDGYSKTCAQDGTVYILDKSVPPVIVPPPVEPPPTDSGSTPPDTQSNTTNQLKIITSPQTVSANTPSQIITVESQDNTGALLKVSATTYVDLSSSSTTGMFATASASDNSCGTDWTKTSVTISKGDANKSFCYEDSTIGTPTITVSSDGFSSDSQIEMIN